MRINLILPLLQKVRKTGRDSYVACCPAHEDRSPSMTLRQVDDGRILIHCFAGCSTQEILSSIGMQFSDLFPERLMEHGKPLRPAFNAHDVMACVNNESRITALAAFNIANGVELSTEDKERLLIASQRLNEAFELSGGR